MSNSLDPDQARHFVGPDLGPNCLQRVSADDKSCHQRLKSYCRFSAIFDNGGNFCDFLFAFVHTKALLKSGLDLGRKFFQLFLCMLGNFACFFGLDFFFFFKFPFSKKSFRNTIRVSNTLDPDQVQHFVQTGSKLFAKDISR